MTNYSVSIDFSFDSDLELYEIEEKVNEYCSELFSNFKNIIIRINRDTTFEMEGYQKSISETSTRQINVENENNFDF